MTMTVTRDEPQETLAIIPARGGSKMIPKKNIHPLAGKPLLAYVLAAIHHAHSVRRVIVDTDNEEIAAIARQYGAETPYVRPAALAEDSTPMIPVVDHALRWLEEHEHYAPEYVLLAQPTEPFIRSDHIDRLFELVTTKGADSGITCIEVPRIFHPYHVRRMTDKGFLEFDQPEMHYAHPTRQSDPRRYAFGNCYWFRRDAFFREHGLEVGRRVGLGIDELGAFDINTPNDLALAECIIRAGLV
ncbi:acylneuraminate cytidylyltransferase family protein [Candidatus Parcubacteria bacterium]|nr:MAG: acylneuraminate cytidylyltransferase family protein [Candidatus Parcubacteria bacterium]